MDDGWFRLLAGRGEAGQRSPRKVPTPKTWIGQSPRQVSTGWVGIFVSIM
jgi:hypothetical protein